MVDGQQFNFENGFMIIGNGMIASSFKNVKVKHKCCIFASGVPNSNELLDSEYQREFRLIKKIFNDFPSYKFIYFSSCSIETGKKSKYISFKLKVEDYIKTNFKDFLILRLPNVVGHTTNKTQLIPFLKEKLLNKKETKVNKSCYRFLLDVVDIPCIVNNLIEKEVRNKVVTVKFNNKISIEEIVTFFINKYNLKNSKIIIYEDDFIELNPDNSFFINLIKNDILDYNQNPIDILNKYF